jgi:predicted metal-dependent hydrolase
MMRKRSINDYGMDFSILFELMLKKVYENWITEKAQNIFEDKVRKYSKKLKVREKGVTIKNPGNGWGSLAKSGAINLNPNLVKAPEDIIDYIVLHELCHLRIKEHSHHYWDLVHSFFPNYQDRIEYIASFPIIKIELNG